MKTKGFPARNFNLLTDELSHKYDLIFANAVLLHFNKEELDLSLFKVYGALKPEGVFSFSLKEGIGETWLKNKLNAQRFFHYWTEDEIYETLNKVGFKKISIAKSTTDGTKWLCIIARKS